MCLLSNRCKLNFLPHTEHLSGSIVVVGDDVDEWFKLVVVVSVVVSGLVAHELSVTVKLFVTWGPV